MAKRLHDSNVFTARKRIGEAALYASEPGPQKAGFWLAGVGIPSKRGLVQQPEQCPRISYRSYAFGELGAVRINLWSEAKIKIRTSAA